jgi:Ca-activated chloride channel family protein
MLTAEVKKHVAVLLGVAVAVVTLGAEQDPAARPDASQEGAFRFKSGVELINVTATVTDAGGRFVPNLHLEDFIVYEDDQPQTVTHFSAERVPVSLGIVVDTSGSMAGEKIQSAKVALNRFVFDLLDREDEIFIYRFSNDPVLLQGWTSDRRLLSRAIDRLSANGETVMYDAVAEAVPLANSGKHRKKALVVISDGNDTSSQISIRELKQLIRESEVLVYAIGIDAEAQETFQPVPRQPRIPIPFPFPPTRRPPGRPLPQIGGPGWGWPRSSSRTDRVNVVALRDMTDDSGGRTEIVRDAGDLNPATARIADELSQQYYLGYSADGKKDGRWHSIRVEVRNRSYRVRARRGYVAS